MTEFIYEWLGKYFASPCDYEFGDVDIGEYMGSENGEWCDEHCGKVEYKECWKRFFQLMKAEWKE